MSIITQSFTNLETKAGSDAESDKVQEDNEVFNSWSGKKGRKKSKWEIPTSPTVYPYEQLWKSFRARSFSGAEASVSSHPCILFHAKLYVFATTYLIEPLRIQCLESLHRDLCGFSLNRETTPLILDLLDFTHAHTGRYEPGGTSLLRNLVIHYVACKVRRLLDDDRLQMLLDADGEMGSDLVWRLAK
ncbi:hypothetical protein PAAG_12672 [Paracoccidioides lutzii Pb01]|uniref:Uncharacterized protein n=1 Tax=Paracoccidioides lutzii (strain ATCC MYA-826 / Pb01) TaxID=502779 RepID=A0A0A2V2V0_PARBA|nr:hypothetical protein PAAG_12672 [Paracoccidioides lutzii Pb01]KGQ00662.1 hypothetical protein PAAG_12672 [Paracoccidioides lutzii Pb01]